MSTETMIIACTLGVALGLLAWVPLFSMVYRAPRAGKPVRTTLRADVSAYSEAMKGARRDGR